MGRNDNILHINPDTYYLSSYFNVNTLVTGMKASLDRLANYKEEPLHKLDVDYHLNQILEGAFILEKYVQQVHDYYITEEDERKIERKYIERNEQFISEHSKQYLTEFYNNIEAHQNKIYDQAKERLAI